MYASRWKRLAATALCVFVAVGAAQNEAFAAVPVSVAIRQQPPEIERVLSMLDAKAAGAKGTWVTKSGRQNVPADTWATVVDGHTWLWKSLVAAPSASAGFLLYCDGEDCYTIPDRVRFQNDTLTQGKFQDFRLGEYLLMLNFEPRQLLGCLNLEKLDDVAVDGAKCVHLRADLAKDPLLKKDQAISGRLALLPILDIYINSQKGAIAQVNYIDRGGFRFEIKTIDWNTFGTSSDWPKSVVTQTFLENGDSHLELAKPYLTSVESFNPGNTSDLETEHQAAAKVPFFSAPLDNLRSVDFYRKEVELNPASTSDRVALAQAAFNEPDAKLGLNTWTMIENSLSDASERELLKQIIMPHAAFAAAWSGQNESQVDACVALMKRLLGQMTPNEKKKYSIALCVGWETLFTNPKTRAAIEPINERLLDLFASSGDLATFRRLVNLAHTKAYKKALEACLNNAAAEPLPKTGFAGSPLSYLVAISLETHDLDGAAAYLQRANWASDTPDSVKAIVPAVLSSIHQVKLLEKQDAGAFPRAIDSFNAFNSQPYSKDVVTSVFVKRALLSGGLNYLSNLIATSDAKAQSLLTSSAQLPGANVYWDELLRAAMRDYGREPQGLITHVGPLLSLYGRTFQQPGYEVNAWIALASSRRGFLGIQVEYLNKALLAAANDSTRFKVILQMAATYREVKEFTSGAQAVSGAAAQLKNPDLVAQAQKLANSLVHQGEVQLAKAQETQKGNRERDRQLELASLRHQLADAKKTGVSPQNIASLQRTIAAMSAQGAAPAQ